MENDKITVNHYRPVLPHSFLPQFHPRAAWRQSPVRAQPRTSASSARPRSRTHQWLQNHRLRSLWPGDTNTTPRIDNDGGRTLWRVGLAIEKTRLIVFLSSFACFGTFDLFRNLDDEKRKRKELLYRLQSPWQRKEGGERQGEKAPTIPTPSRNLPCWVASQPSVRETPADERTNVNLSLTLSLYMLLKYYIFLFVLHVWDTSLSRAQLACRKTLVKRCHCGYSRKLVQGTGRCWLYSILPWTAGSNTMDLGGRALILCVMFILATPF